MCVCERRWWMPNARHRPPHCVMCVLTGYYECSDDRTRGGCGALRCYNTLTTQKTRTHTCFLPVFRSYICLGANRSPTHAHIKHDHSPKSVWRSRLFSPALTFTCSFCPRSFSLPVTPAGAPAFHYRSRHFSAYTTGRARVCAGGSGVSMPSTLRRSPVDNNPIM